MTQEELLQQILIEQRAIHSILGYILSILFVAFLYFIIKALFRFIGEGINLGGRL